MILYVGNLPYAATEAELREAFAAHGEVSSVRIIVDRDSGRSRGYGFVEMGSDAAARAAIAELGGRAFMGRKLRVSPADRRSGKEESQ